MSTVVHHTKVPAALPSVERVFVASSDSYVYATNNLQARFQLPFFGWVLVAIDNSPIQIRVGNRELSERAMAIWPHDVQFLGPPVRFVAIAVNPFHRLFRAFTQIGKSNAILLEVERFASLRDLMLSALVSPRFMQHEFETLAQSVLESAAPSLPTQSQLDARALRLMKLLSDNPRCSLSELAQSLSLSYHRTSHLFTEAVGITVRTYQLWQKLYRASDPMLKGASLTAAAHAAGFVDSAHFSRSFQTAYGRSPSEAMRVRRLVVYEPDVFTKAAIDQTLAAS
jgi:AraC-like DNA-binding protein